MLPFLFFILPFIFVFFNWEPMQDNLEVDPLIQTLIKELNSRTYDGVDKAVSS